MALEKIDDLLAKLGGVKETPKQPEMKKIAKQLMVPADPELVKEAADLFSYRVITNFDKWAAKLYSKVASGDMTNVSGGSDEKSNMQAVADRIGLTVSDTEPPNAGVSAKKPTVPGTNPLETLEGGTPVEVKPDVTPGTEKT